MHGILFRHRLALLLLSFWLGAMVVAFWWFELRHWRSWQSPVAAPPVQLQHLGLSPTADRLTVVHFIDPDCRCGIEALAHVRSPELLQRLGTTREWLMIPNATDTRRSLPPLAVRRLDHSPLITPAVGIWDPQGRLLYYGPYSSGAHCGTGVDFLQAALQAIDAGRQPESVDPMTTGCFCQPATLT